MDVDEDASPGVSRVSFHRETVPGSRGARATTCRPRYYPAIVIQLKSRTVLDFPARPPLLTDSFVARSRGASSCRPLSRQVQLRLAGVLSGIECLECNLECFQTNGVQWPPTTPNFQTAGGAFGGYLDGDTVRRDFRSNVGAVDCRSVDLVDVW